MRGACRLRVSLIRLQLSFDVSHTMEELRVRRSVLLFAFLAGCDRELTAVSDSQLSVRQNRGSAIFNITNIGASGVTVAALDRESYNLADLAPCETWPALATGADTTIAFSPGTTEVVVIYCVFPIPPPARPSRIGTLIVPVR